MKTRPFTEEEISRVYEAFEGRYALRDRALFLLGLYAGFRISELLSLQIRDVWADGQAKDAVSVQRRNMKGKRSSRTVPLHPRAQEAIAEYAEAERLSDRDCRLPLFASRKGGDQRPISRVQAYLILQRVCDHAGIPRDNIGTHSWRKTFARRVYAASGNNIFLTQKCLGHKSVDSTAHYLEASAEEVNGLILSV